MGRHKKSRSEDLLFLCSYKHSIRNTVVAKPHAAAVNCDTSERVLWTKQRGFVRKKQGVMRVRMQSLTTMFLTELYILYVIQLELDMIRAGLLTCSFLLLRCNPK